MARYLISFPSGAMDHIPEEMAEVDEAAHAVVREAKDAGVFIFAGGLDEGVAPVLVAGDGTVNAGTYPQTEELNGGFTVVDVPTREAALAWAAKIAVACRCAQEVREFMFDPRLIGTSGRVSTGIGVPRRWPASHRLEGPVGVTWGLGWPSLPLGCGDGGSQRD